MFSSYLFLIPISSKSRSCHLQPIYHLLKKGRKKNWEFFSLCTSKNLKLCVYLVLWRCRKCRKLVYCTLSPHRQTVTTTFKIKCSCSTAASLLAVCLSPVFSPGYLTLQPDSVMYFQEQARKNWCHKGCNSS